jgi:RHS repeat-associated protein
MTRAGYNYDSTVYYRARYYDPTIGRFLSEDPIRFRGGKDFYSYVDNNPANFTDALGLKTCDSCKNAAPMSSDSPACNDYGNETLEGVSLKCFCKCAGDSPWSLQVRGCLACEHKNGTNMIAAHARCMRGLAYTKRQRAPSEHARNSAVSEWVALCGDTNSADE